MLTLKLLKNLHIIGRSCSALKAYGLLSIFSIPCLSCLSFKQSLYILECRHFGSGPLVTAASSVTFTHEVNLGWWGKNVVLHPSIDHPFLILALSVLTQAISG